MTKRNMVQVRSVDLNYELDGLFVDGLTRLRGMAEELVAEGATEIIFDTDEPEWCEGHRLLLVGNRPENDEERATREDKERSEAEIRRRYDEAQYERLKKKFEGA